MTDVQEEVSSKQTLEWELELAEAHRNACFEQIQEILNLSKDVILNLANKSEFLCKMHCIDQIKRDFRDYDETCNRLTKTLKPKSAFDGKKLKSFLDICYKMEYLHSNLLKLDTVESKPARRCRLPSIELVSFDGKLDNWNEFYVSFKSNVHDNSDLNNEEKLFYLLGRLSGKAKLAILGIDPSGENYELIFKTLRERYEDKRGLAHSYIHKILEFKTLNGHSLKEFEEFLDGFVSPYNALSNLKIPNLLDFVMVHLAMKKLDLETVRNFEMQLNEEFPSFEKFIDFVKRNMKIQQNLGNRNVVTAKSVSKNSPRAFLCNSENNLCQLCEKGDHKFVYSCSKFLDLPARARFEEIKKMGLCINCLKNSHLQAKCPSQNSCKVCNARHHSLLHFEKKVVNTVDPGDGNVVAGVTLCSTNEVAVRETVLLGTAIVKFRNNDGKWVGLRALVDNASQSDFITMSCCKRLKLEVFSDKGHNFVHGIGAEKHPVLGIAKLEIFSRHNDSFTLELQPLVIDHISDRLPTSMVNRKQLKYLENIPLADERYHSPGEVDIIIGARSFPLILRSGRISGNKNTPYAIESELGYLIMGTAPTITNNLRCQNNRNRYENLSSFCTISSSVDVLLTKFWELERLPERSINSPEETKCEEYYVRTTRRNDEGRYVVALPFKEDPGTLGDSFNSARRRYLSQEKRMSEETKIAYNQVIQEYLSKGFISKTSENLSSGYYIPHHGIVREDKLSTRLRVVLDASAKTSKGISLNDILHTGKNLQLDIFGVLLNLRLFPIVISADIRQMYLQIKVQEDYHKYQRILYRFSSDEKLECYQFNCVTFGMKCSPFLALRTIRQLALDEKSKYPLAAEIIKRDIYMDDVVSSVRSEEEAREVSHQLRELFRAGGFELVKFCSNSASVLKNIPEASRLSNTVDFDNEEVLKILGMCWLPQEDLFSYKVSTDFHDSCTKRNILSTIARLWDVLGLVAPCILYAKLLLRKLWILNLDWDETPPVEVMKTWTEFVNELNILEKIKVPRHIGLNSDGALLSLIGFADASENAYGAVIYAYVELPNSEPLSRLICAKSRVAPLKTLSIPRLELCAAVLLAQLLSSVRSTYASRHRIFRTIAFSDSTVVLNWIHSSPHRWQTFVANRVSQIHDLVDFNNFHHVDGKQNPADCLSRGLTPSQMLDCSLWFDGPPWFRAPISEWPIHPFKEFVSDIPEKRTYSFVTTATTQPLLLEIASKVSSWGRLLRRIVYVYRFAKMLPRRKFISSGDLRFAEEKIIQELQKYHFSNDIDKLRTGSNCARALQKLRPFLDKNNMIRVGGRLNHSKLSFEGKHPLILPSKSHIVNLIVDYYHKIFCHAGPDLLLSILRQNYWIFSARNIIRSRVHKCKQCFRLRPTSTSPEMADLKACQVVQSVKPFIHTGTDFAGPFKIVLSRRRGAKTFKAYICLFVCLTTKGVHIELVSDLSTECFLSAFKRFLSRRGPVSHVYSDCGRNYVGARRYLDELQQFLSSAGYSSSFTDLLSENQIEWHLNIPTAAHHGGAWESNIKSLKVHLYRVIGQQILSYEEMSTILTQVEAVMNSRPLCRVLSCDPSEPMALTPAHFLNYTPLKFLPIPAEGQDQLSLTTRQTLLDEMVRSFWRRWRMEYLHNLQVRQKWNTSRKPIEVGQVVIVSTDNLPTLHWPLGIVDEVFPGRDGIVRSVKVRTKDGSYLRPAVRICPLPEP